MNKEVVRQMLINTYYDHPIGEEDIKKWNKSESTQERQSPVKK